MGVVKATFFLFLSLFSFPQSSISRREQENSCCSLGLQLCFTLMCPAQDGKEGVTEQPEPGLAWVAMDSGTLRRKGSKVLQPFVIQMVGGR